jgi:hypothetical protein
VCGVAHASVLCSAATRTAAAPSLRQAFGTLAKKAQVLRPTLDARLRKYVPVNFLNWLKRGALVDFWAGDIVPRIQQSAAAHSAVGALALPALCFVYIPFLVMICAVVALPSPADEKLSFDKKDLKTFAAFLIIGFVVCANLGGLWKNSSSHGLGNFEF